MLTLKSQMQELTLSLCPSFRGCGTGTPLDSFSLSCKLGTLCLATTQRRVTESEGGTCTEEIEVLHPNFPGVQQHPNVGQASLGHKSTHNTRCVRRIRVIRSLTARFNGAECCSALQTWSRNQSLDCRLTSKISQTHGWGCRTAVESAKLVLHLQFEEAYSVEADLYLWNVWND